MGCWESCGGSRMDGTVGEARRDDERGSTCGARSVWDQPRATSCIIFQRQATQYH